MRVVAFVSEMPGSGKTVLAGHVAAQAVAEGVGQCLGSGAVLVEVHGL